MRFGICVSMAVLITASVQAVIIHVPADQPSIQSGINAAANDDTVLVAPGLYSENISFVGKRIVLASSGGASATEIHGLSGSEATVRIVNSESKGVELSGFRISGGAKGGVYCLGSSPTILRNIITGNSHSGNVGGGISLKNTTGSYIRGNVIHGNTGIAYGSAIHVGDDYASSTNDTICYNVMYNNEGWGDIRTLGTVSGLSIFNNTIVVTTLGGIGSQSTGTINARNNIITGASGYAIHGNMTNDYNCLFGNSTNYQLCTPGIGNVYQDALFINPATRDYRLQITSPCVDAGDPDPMFNDLDGTRNDIGALTAFQSLPYPMDLSLAPLGGLGTVSSLTPHFLWTFYDTGVAVQAAYQIEVGTDADWGTAEMWNTGEVSSSSTDVVYAGAVLEDKSSYYLRIRVSNGSNWGEWASTQFYVNLGGTIRVPLDQPTIQSGINAALNGDTVLVAAGTYFESISLLGKKIFLKSEAGRDATVIRYLGSGGRVVYCGNGEDTNTVIDGFGIDGNHQARGIVCNFSSPVIQNCEIFNCSYSSDGAGIYCTNSSAKIRLNKVHDNTSGLTGGGICAQGTPATQLEISYNEIWGTGSPGEAIGCLYAENTTIQHNVIRNNTANHWAASGVYLNGTGTTVRIINNTIVGNTHGIVSATGAQPVIRNNIVVNNTQGGIESDMTNRDYNDVWNNGGSDNPGPYDISVDPQFMEPLVSDYHLLATSPCIDAGDPDSQYNDSDGTRNDMGAWTSAVTHYPVVRRLRLEAEENGHVKSHTPQFIWEIVSQGGQPQDSFEIAVGTDQDWAIAEAWSPGAVASSLASVVYAGAPLLDANTYYIRIRIHCDTSWSYWSSGYFHMNGLPTVPTPLRPIGGTIRNVSTPSLVLAAATDADTDQLTYEYEVYSDSTLSSLVASAVNVTPAIPEEIEWTVTVSLIDNVHYYWRGRAYDSFEHSNWSSVSDFWVNLSPQSPSAPDLFFPPDPARLPVFSLKPVFRWAASIDGDPHDTVHYTLELSLNSIFQSPIQYENIYADSLQIPDSLEFGTRYWWRVRAIDKTGLSTLSGTSENFWTWALGDVNHSHLCDLGDLSGMVSYLTGGGYPLSPKRAGDLNGSCFVDLTDLSIMVSYLTGGGAVLMPGCE